MMRLLGSSFLSSSSCASRAYLAPRRACFNRATLFLRFMRWAFLWARIRVLSVDTNDALHRVDLTMELFDLGIDDIEVRKLWRIDGVVDVHDELLHPTNELPHIGVDVIGGSC